MKSQISFEQARFKELEALLERERRSAHTNHKTVAELEQSNREFQEEAERQKLRVESKCEINPL